VTVKAAAQRLEVSTSTIYALVAAGKLRCHRVGLGRGAIRISEEHLEDYLKAGEPEKTPVPPTPLAPRRPFKHLKLS
jgi:excisionase family DNA binding protein